MAKLPGDKFLELLRRSDLVDAKSLDKSLAELSAQKGEAALLDGDLVSEHLINAGLITAWQRDKLMEGRHKGFFVGKYKLHSLLGAGGMSHVYLAEHRQMRRRVAIKVLPKAKTNNTSYLERFYLEARAAAALDHPNIVRAYDIDFDEEQNVHYFVMEYVQGRDLQATVKQRGPLPYAEAAEFIRQAALGLEHAHQVGMVHRDIKPANLLIDLKGTVRILDMGLARFDEPEKDNEKASLTVTHEENVLGTADYLAPEQAINSHSVDARADIYSLGCTLYYLLTGRPPFPEGTITQRLLKHQTAEPAPIVKTRPDAPQEIVDICRKMMAKKPENRFQTTGDVATALTGFISAVRGDSGVLAASGTASAKVGGSDSNLRGRGDGGSGPLRTDGVESAPNAGSPFQDTAPNLMPTIKVSGSSPDMGLPQIDTSGGSKKGSKTKLPAVEAAPAVNVHDAATLPEVRIGGASASGKGAVAAAAPVPVAAAAGAPVAQAAAPAPIAKKKKVSTKKARERGQMIILVGILVMMALFAAVLIPLMKYVNEQNRLFEEDKKRKQEQKKGVLGQFDPTLAPASQLCVHRPAAFDAKFSQNG
ncbi:MAG: serine/threonine protein kinase [Planctomycetaceae bacterium]|nr:serine/threonine protein kinase [Planctomycetaceae bacterium]